MEQKIDKTIESICDCIQTEISNGVDVYSANYISNMVNSLTKLIAVRNQMKIAFSKEW